MMYQLISTMDPIHGGIKVTDTDITKSLAFTGHCGEYLKWPEELWVKPGHIPDENVARNAYHVLYFVNVMREKLLWIGTPIQIYSCWRHIRDGNHRYRATQYLWDTLGVSVSLGEIQITKRICWYKECK